MYTPPTYILVPSYIKYPSLKYIESDFYRDKDCFENKNFVYSEGGWPVTFYDREGC